MPNCPFPNISVFQTVTIMLGEGKIAIHSWEDYDQEGNAINKVLTWGWGLLLQPLPGITGGTVRLCSHFSERWTGYFFPPAHHDLLEAFPFSDLPAWLLVWSFPIASAVAVALLNWTHLFAASSLEGFPLACSQPARSGLGALKMSCPFCSWRRWKNSTFSLALLQFWSHSSILGALASLSNGLKTGSKVWDLIPWSNEFSGFFLHMVMSEMRLWSALHTQF